MKLTPHPVPTFQLPEIFLFDWDSTLVASMEKLKEVWYSMLQDVIDRGKTHKKHIKEFVPLEAVPHLPVAGVIEWIFEEARPDVETIYWEHYARLYRTQPAEGAVNLLEWLKKRGVRMGIVSNHQGPQLRENIQSAHLEEYFEVLIGAGDSPYSKPDPQIVHFALEQFADPMVLRGPTQKVWFAGDSMVDLTCAAEAKVLPVWVEIHSNQADQIRNLICKKGSIPCIHCHNLQELHDQLAAAHPRP